MNLARSLQLPRHNIPLENTFETHISTYILKVWKGTLQLAAGEDINSKFLTLYFSNISKVFDVLQINNDGPIRSSTTIPMLPPTGSAWLPTGMDARCSHLST